MKSIWWFYWPGSWICIHQIFWIRIHITEKNIFLHFILYYVKFLYLFNSVPVSVQFSTWIYPIQSLYLQFSHTPYGKLLVPVSFFVFVQPLILVFIQRLVSVSLQRPVSFSLTLLLCICSIFTLSQFKSDSVFVQVQHTVSVSVQGSVSVSVQGSVSVSVQVSVSVSIQGSVSVSVQRSVSVSVQGSVPVSVQRSVC